LAVTTIVVTTERVAGITARARASLDEALVATSASRPVFNRLEVMETLKSTAWLGRGIALQGLLKLVSNMRLKM
jgi:hypothetical protein